MTTVSLPELRTERLILRCWREEDREPFARMNADARVVEYLSPPLSREASDASVDRCNAHFEARGFTFWALEIPGVTNFAGFIGLVVPSFEAHFTPCVEVGWRLAAEYWGRGYATEGARAVVSAGFAQLGLDEIVSLTVPANKRSRHVMEKLGMSHSPGDDFDHPRLNEGDPLRRHVLYRLARAAWKEQR
jgi:RimJ/RimL family protein N-acetyltransferase